MANFQLELKNAKMIVNLISFVCITSTATLDLVYEEGCEERLNSVKYGHFWKFCKGRVNKAKLPKCVIC